MPATSAAIDPYRRSLHSTESNQVKALHQDVASRMQAGVIPDDAHRVELIADGNAREIVHREAVIAWDEGSLHRVDADGIDLRRPRARRSSGQRQARGRNVIDNFLHRDAATHTTEERCIIVLKGNVDVAGLDIDGWIGTLILTAIGVRRGDDKVGC